MSKPDFDVYGNMSWTQRAAYGVYGIALDHGDRTGRKNRFIDAVHQTAIRRALRATGRRFQRALDFGCGGGRLLPLLKEFAHEVFGVDRTPACLDIARAQNTIPADHLVCWREGPAPFADASFDLVLCVYVLLTGEALDTLTSELARLCAPGGLALVLEQADNSRSLTLDRYRNAFAQAGLRLQSSTALRRSHGSAAMRWAIRRWAPSWLPGAMARWELASMQKVRYDAQTPHYFDYLFVLVKD